MPRRGRTQSEATARCTPPWHSSTPVAQSGLRSTGVVTSGHLAGFRYLGFCLSSEFIPAWTSPCPARAQSGLGLRRRRRLGQAPAPAPGPGLFDLEVQRGAAAPGASQRGYQDSSCEYLGPHPLSPTLIPVFS